MIKIQLRQLIYLCFPVSLDNLVAGIFLKKANIDNKLQIVCSIKTKTLFLIQLLKDTSDAVCQSVRWAICTFGEFLKKFLKRIRLKPMRAKEWKLSMVHNSFFLIGVVAFGQ